MPSRWRCTGCCRTNVAPEHTGQGGPLVSSYSLPDHVNVESAQLENGLLTINLKQDIPENEKPKKIAIENRNQAGTQALEHEH
ncbi:Hsp20 family protein [Dickeya dianthicola]|uniref:Hsp20 family protein n=1 Tax=Dickeya dianthicola TaxID=204039 RepID=UPI001E65B2B2|nr:Hsp20 family protein [Dickeya dianthicola]